MRLLHIARTRVAVTTHLSQPYQPPRSTLFMIILPSWRVPTKRFALFRFKPAEQVQVAGMKLEALRQNRERPETWRKQLKH